MAKNISIEPCTTIESQVAQLTHSVVNLEHAISHLTAKLNNVEAKAAHDKNNATVVRSAVEERVDDAMEALDRAIAQQAATNVLLCGIATSIRNAR